MAVFPGRRIRDNNVQGTISDNPLTAVATTVNSADMANLSAISGDHAVMVLDPLRTTGAPEIVIVIAHTASATQATISRAALGTTARSHAAGTAWVHPATDADLIEILAADPADFYGGQLWYRSDTKTYMAHDGSAVVPAVPIGAWTTWTPTWTNLTVGNATVVAAFTKIGRTVHYRLSIVLGSTSAVGTDPRFSFPVDPIDYPGANTPVGTVMMLDAGVINYLGAVFASSTLSQAEIVGFHGAQNGQMAVVTATAPFTFAVGDSILATGTYEAAA